MKKIKTLILLLCFCMLLPLTACGKTEGPDNTDGYKPKYDGLTRETAADLIPDDYDMEAQTIGLFYGNHFEKSVIGDGETKSEIADYIVKHSLEKHIKWIFSIKLRCNLFYNWRAPLTKHNNRPKPNTF